MKVVFDLEGTNLLDHNSIDYTASPYKLLPSFKVHCLVAKDIESKKKYKFVRPDGQHPSEHADIPGFKEVLKMTTTLIGHNIIDYDLLVLKLYGVIEDYIISEDWRECLLSIDGKSYEMAIFDTLVASKTMNPDRYGGHSLDEWGKRVGVHKIDWRGEAVTLGLIEANAPRGAEFQKYHPKMLEYNEQDVDTNEAVYYALVAEWGNWKWDGPFSLEQQVRDIVTRQQHRGFWYNKQLAEESVRDLDQKMEEIRAIVEPLIPAKPLGVTKLKQYLPPKIQFKKNGEPSAVMLKWAEKHGGAVVEASDGWQFEYKGEQWKMPMDPETAIETHEPATVKDVTHIKQWLVEIGWEPSAYKERDLTCDSKKNKLPSEKFKIAVERYVEQTLQSPFCKDRCEALDVNPKFLLARLLKHDAKRPLKVYTNPTLTVGAEKEMDPKLLELGDKFPHAKLVSDYLTYSHRRNSILGGGQEVFDDDDRDEEDEYAGKGWLAVERLGMDERIPTPADTLGAATSRMRHRLVTNIPRVTSLYGEKMRAQFGVNPSEPVFQMGYDFASLEARLESHYCWRYDDEHKEYCKSLLLEKPNDVHTVTAKKVSVIIGQDFGRTPAKTTKYACAYGASAKRVARTVGCSLELGEKIHAAYWEAAKPLGALGEKLKEYWTRTGGKRFILGIDGRKIPTRSASALINSLFQSAGAICAKRTMVLHEKKLRERGLVCDFFVDDWRNKVFAQQLIAMHDEAQMEIHKSLVKWKLFKTEEEAIAFKKESEGWSAIGHSDKGWYVGKSIVADLAVEAANETSELYGLNVPLGIEFIFGRNWGECH